MSRTMNEGDRDLRTAATMIDSRLSTTSRPLAVGGRISPIAVVFAFELLERARNPWKDIWRAALVSWIRSSFNNSAVVLNDPNAYRKTQASPGCH